MRKMMLAFLAFALVAGACGGDDDDTVSADDSPLVGALADEIASGAEPGDFAPTREEAECWAGRIVGGIGEDRLTELGVTVDNVGDIEDYEFSDGEIDTIVDGLDECTDLQGALAEVFEEDFGAEGAECVAGELEGDLLKDLFRASLSGADEPPEEFFQVFLDIAAKCDLPLG